MSKTVNVAFAKIAVAFVAIAMMFSVVAPASAQNLDDMSTAELVALINQLLGETEAEAGVDASVCPYTWTRDLSMGSTGADVMALQQFLNSMPETQVAPAGSTGSAGMETQYYGPATGAAVANFQMKYRAEILTPLGLVNPTQYFGAGSRAQANDLCVADAVVPGDDDDEMDDDDDEVGSDELGNGEGDIDTIRENSSDDSDVEEGALGAIFEFEVEIEGDVEIDRVDLYMDATAAGSESDNADDYFTEAQLWVDGEEVASLDVDDFDEDNYGIVDVVTGSGDEFRLRFSNLGLVFEDGDEPVFVLGLVGANNIDTADQSETWGVDMANDSIRFVDGQGFTGTEGNTSVQETFGIDEEESAELDITKSSDSEDARTIEVDTDDQSSAFPIMILEIEEENDVDVTIDEMTMTASTTDTDVTKAIDEVLLVVNGETIGSDSPTAGGALTFEDLDLEIGAEETVEVEVHVIFNGTDDYSEGDVAFVTFNAVTEAEDENGNDESDITGSNPSDFSSDVFTLRSEGIAITLDDVTATESTKDSGSGDIEKGTYEFEITVEAFGEDFYIDEDSAVIDFDLLVGGTAAAAASSTATLSISGGDAAASSDYRIARGDEVTLTLRVETADDVTGSARVRVNSVAYSAADDGTEELTETATPAIDWRSAELNLSN